MKETREQQEFFEKFEKILSSSSLTEKNIKLRTLEFYNDLFLWQYHNIYLELFVRFTNFSISGEEFVEQFFDLRNLHIEKFAPVIKKLKNDLTFATELPITDKALGFGNLVSEIFFDCDAFVSDELLEEIEDVREEGEIDESQLRARVEQTILIMEKKYCNLERKIIFEIKNHYS